MRQIDPKDEVPALGKKVEKPPMPRPHIKINGKDGVYRAPDGKFYTDKPENEIANPNPWMDYPYISFWRMFR